MPDVIAIDTNVLIRYLVRDDIRQAEAARALLESLSPENPAFICREALIETVWVLERSYRLARTQIADLLEELRYTDSFIFEAGDDLDRATLRYRSGGADFADLMILSAAQRTGANPLYTLDRRLARFPGTTLLEPDRQ